MLEDLDELRVLINRRYGHGTYEKIKQDYQERVAAQKEQEKLERQEHVRKMARYREYFQTGAIIFILATMIIVGVLIYFKYLQDNRSADINVGEVIDDDRLDIIQQLQ